MKKRLTNAERLHLERVKALGCLICQQQAEAHHIREGAGMGQRNGHYLTIPLCATHHRGDLGIHARRRWFQQQYGDELTLLDRTISELMEIWQC